MATISAEEFTGSCIKFFEASNAIRDGWELKEDLNNQRPYMIKKFTQNISKPLQSDESLNEENNIDNCFVIMECHILYSESYANPVLYFTACQLNGQILRLEQCWEMVDSHHHSIVTSDEKWSFLTQVEHPIFLKPFYQLHPCHTKDFMKLFDLRNKQLYIVSWLSIVLPVLNLDFPIHNYHEHFNKSLTANLGVNE